MPKSSSIALLVVALALGAPVHAQTQLEMNQSADRSLREMEAKLDAAVAAYRKLLTPSQTVAFDDSQRQWTNYRKAACDFQASGVVGGSAYSMILALCLTDYANERLNIVTRLMSCTEGNLSCPAFRRGP